MTHGSHSYNAVFEKNMELIKNTASILCSVTNLSIAPGLIEVVFTSIPTVLVEMLLSKQIDLTKNMYTAIRYVNVSTFNFPWLYKKSYGESMNILA